MSVRVGESWRGRNGHRYWVSMPLGTWLAGAGCWVVLVLPLLALWWMLLAELWLAAEALLLTVTGIIVIIAVARREAGAPDITMRRLRWRLYAFGLKGDSGG